MAKTKDSDSGADEEAPTVSITIDQLKELIATAVSSAVAESSKLVGESVAAALRAQGGRKRLVGQDLTDRVKAIKRKTGAHGRPPLPDLPPPGHALISNQFGRGVKMVELYMCLSPEVVVLPFADRSAPRYGGQFWNEIQSGQRKLKAITPYPTNLIRNHKTGETVSLQSALPVMGSADSPVPLSETLEMVDGSLCDFDYAKAVQMKRSQEQAAA